MMRDMLNSIHFRLHPPAFILPMTRSLPLAALFTLSRSGARAARTLLRLRVFRGPARGLLKLRPVFEDVCEEGARGRGLVATERDHRDRARQSVPLDAQKREATRLRLLAHGPRRHERDAEAVLDHELDEIRVVGFERERRAEVDALEEGVCGASYRGSLLEEYEALAAQFTHVNLLRCGEAVARADDQSQLVLEQLRHLERGRVDRKRREANVCRAVEYVGHGLLG